MRNQKTMNNLDDLKLLVDITKNLRVGHHDDNLTYLASEIAQAVKADCCSVFLLDKKNEVINAKVMTNEWKTISFPKGSGIAGYVIDSGIEVITQDPYADPRFNQEIDKKTGYKTKEIMCIPIVSNNDDPIGCIEVMNKLEGKFDSRDKSFVTSLGSAIANILESSLILKEKNELVVKLEETKHDLLKKVNQMDIILKLEKDNNLGLPIDECMHTAIEECVLATESSSGMILLLDDESCYQQYSFIVGCEPEKARAVQVDQRDDLIQQVMKSGEPIIKNDIASDSEHGQFYGEKHSAVVKNIMMSPLLISDYLGDASTQVLGIVEVINADRGYYDNNDLGFFRVICAQISSMIQRQRLYESQEKSERLALIGRVSSTIVHDLKNPLAAILMAARFLGEKEIADPRRIRFATMISNQAKRMEIMALEILSYIKEKMDFKFEDLKASEFFDEVFHLLEVECELKEIKLHKDIQYDGLLRIDKSKMQRSIFNLTNNAFGVLSPGNSLYISCKSDNGNIVIRVADDGPGIPKEIIDSLFNSFVTLNKQQGTGLGLNIVQTIVSRHGGKISVNQEPEQGAEFDIILPGIETK